MKRSHSIHSSTLGTMVSRVCFGLLISTGLGACTAWAQGSTAGASGSTQAAQTPANAAPNTSSTPASADAASTPALPPMGYKVVKEGKGDSPTATDVVRVHYRGTFPNGKEFDSSYSRGKPAEFPLNRVIKCWTEGVQRMKVGGVAKLVCPPHLAYGERGARDVIPPNSTLHFDVELLGIVGK